MAKPVVSGRTIILLTGQRNQADFYVLLSLRKHVGSLGSVRKLMFGVVYKLAFAICKALQILIGASHPKKTFDVSRFSGRRKGGEADLRGRAGNES